MKAGSLQVIGKTARKRLRVASLRTPVVEIDTEATAAYVRFGHGPVARTEPYGESSNLVTVDFDRKDRVLGIEIVGRKEFSIVSLLRGIPLSLGENALLRTRYVSADLKSRAA